MLNQNRNLAPRENLEVNLNPGIRDLEGLEGMISEDLRKRNLM